MPSKGHDSVQILIKNREYFLMKYQGYLAVALLFSILSNVAVATNEPCKVSGKVLSDVPQDLGFRSRKDIMPALAKAELFDIIMLEPKCSRTGSILLAITIAPDGSVLKVRTSDSTFPDSLVEDHLTELIPAINFGEIEGQGFSVVYVPFVFEE